MKHERSVSELDGVSSIGTALETGHHGIALCKIIHDLAFSLVAPLEAQDYIECFHISIVRKCEVNANF